MNSKFIFQPIYQTFPPRTSFFLLEILFFKRLYRERVTQIESKLAEVRAGRAPEYLQPLEELQINMKNRMEVSTVLRELRLTNINCKFEAEQLATQQNFQVQF